jgi:hypothetical protein
MSTNFTTPAQKFKSQTRFKKNSFALGRPDVYSRGISESPHPLEGSKVSQVPEVQKFIVLLPGIFGTPAL